MQASTARRLRQLHHWLGVFFAPALIFFALSGVFQTFRWQEERGYGGTPPRWIVWISSVHIDQAEPREKLRKPPSARPDGEARRPEGAGKRAEARRSPFPLKVFVGVFSILLIAASLLGIALALTNRARRRGSLIALGAGIVLPLLLLLI